ncbi:hypothetical protein Efla_003257 [Eimeria flavescens]
MDSPRPQLPEALPSAELFPAQPSCPETRPAAHSSLLSGYHSSSNHPSFGSHEVLEALAAAMHRLTLSSQASKAPAMAPIGPSSAASASYGASLKDLKYPTYDGSRTSNRSHHVLDDWTAFNRIALTRLQQLRSAGACIYEDEAEFACVPAAEPPFFSKNRNGGNSIPQAANGLVLFAVSHTCGKNAQRISVLAVRMVLAHVRASAVELKAFYSGSAMESSHQHMEEMSSQLPTSQLRSAVIHFATEPLQLQCHFHRSFAQPLVSNGVSFDLLVGLDWLQKNNPRIDWDHGSLMLSGSDHCYKWEAVYSDAEFHPESVAIRLCTARQIGPYPAANEAYCNYV